MLRAEMVGSRSDEMRRRRAMVVASLVGAASMAAVTLRQVGLVKHLPDPPVPGFDSDKVNLSETAYRYGAPDGTIALAGFAANLPLVTFAAGGRAKKHPWIPLGLAAKTMVDAAVSGWYFYQMPAKEKAWCGYCITAALASIAMFALTLPDARQALRQTIEGD
jgi:uncharacterized membrane protein